VTTPISAEPRKQPVQRRSRALVGALTKAAARVLSYRSLDKATTNEVADLAGVSIGSHT
jgi:AcrR family transcriptional regulator